MSENDLKKEVVVDSFSKYLSQAAGFKKSIAEFLIDLGKSDLTHPQKKEVFEMVMSIREFRLFNPAFVQSGSGESPHAVKPVLGSLSILEGRTLGNSEKCYYCGRIGSTTKDHFYPKSLGGRLCVRACRSCNYEKGRKKPLEWILHLQHLIAACENERNIGCARRGFIRSRCEVDCPELLILKRMLCASQSLWDRVQWSINPEYY